MRITSTSLEVRPKPNLFLVVQFALVEAAVFAHGGRDNYLVGLIIAAVELVLWLVAFQIIRLVADEHGVRVGNWIHRYRFEWAEIVDVKRGYRKPESGWNPAVAICLSDGRERRAMATLGGFSGGYSDDEQGRIIESLRHLRVHYQLHPSLPKSERHPATRGRKRHLQR